MSDIGSTFEALVKPVEVAQAPPAAPPPLLEPSAVVPLPGANKLPAPGNEFSLPPADQAINEFSIQSIRDAEETRGRASVLSAQGSNPDAVAKALALSKKTGVPVDVIEADPRPAEERVAVNEFSALSPGVKRWLSQDPINAKVSGADYEKLGVIDRTINEIMRPVFSFLSNRQAANYEQGVRLSMDLDEAKIGRAHV